MTVRQFLSIKVDIMSMNGYTATYTVSCSVGLWVPIQESRPKTHAKAVAFRLQAFLEVGVDLDPRPVLFFLPLNDDNVDGVGALTGEAEIV